MKNGNASLSVIMTALNASKTIGLSLLSICVFMPRGTKILLYLDGGKTESKILNSLEAMGRLLVVRGEKTQGVSASLNRLITMVQTEFVARLDADDIALPFFHKKAISLIRKKRSDLVFANAILFGLKLRFPHIAPQVPYSISPGEAPGFLALGNPFVHPTMVCRTETLLSSGGYRECSAEDYELWMRLALSGFKHRRLARYGVLYRVHGGQVTNDKSYQERVDRDTVITKLKNRILAISTATYPPDAHLHMSAVRETLLERNFGYRVSYMLSNLLLKSKN